MKKSKDSFKAYENEVKSMNTRVLELQKTKKALLNKTGEGKKKKKQQEQHIPSMRDVEEMAFKWNLEKEQLNKDRDELKLQCSEI